MEGVEVYDKYSKKLDDKYINVKCISSIPSEEVFDEKGNKVKAVYRKVEEDTPVDDIYNRFGNKLYGIYKNI